MKQFYRLMLLCLIFSGQAVAGEIPAAQEKSLNYLTPDAIDVANALPAPPVTGSSQDLEELQTILSLQASRSQMDCARASAEAEPTFANFFGPPYGPLTAEETMKWTEFMGRVFNDAKYFTKLEKENWNRPRPYLEDSNIHPCVPTESSSAYPSGHATAAWVFADVLSLVSPEQKDDFFDRAAQVAQDRVLGGVHHPSDIAAAQQLADEIFQALKLSARFQSDLAQASENQ